MTHSRAVGRLARAVLLACITGSVLVGRVAGAAALITISVSPTSGAPGQTFTISGSGYAAGTTYGLCILPADKGKCGFDGADIAAPSSFAAAAGGVIPTGTSGRVPNLLAGAYKVASFAPDGVIIATTPFTVTAPVLSIVPTSGASGTKATLTLSGGAPNTSYTVCADPLDVPACGGVGIEMGDFTTDASGVFPAGTVVRIPDQLPATYHIGIHIQNGGATLIATADFVETAPTITLGISGGPAGTVITVTGTGFAPGATYQLCLVSGDANQCGGAGTILGGFEAGPTGAIPDGLTVTAPAANPAADLVGVLLVDSAPWLLASAPFALGAGTAVPAVTPPTQTPASTPVAATPTPAPSSAPAGAESGGGTFPWVLLVILLIVVVALAFWYSRRRRESPPAN